MVDRQRADGFGNGRDGFERYQLPGIGVNVEHPQRCRVPLVERVKFEDYLVLVGRGKN